MREGRSLSCLQNRSYSNLLSSLFVASSPACTTARTHIHGTFSHSLQVLTFTARTYIHFTAVCASFVQDSSPGDDTYPHTEVPIAGATEGRGEGEGEGEGGLGSVHSPVAARCRRGVEGALHRGAEAVKARCRDALGVCESLCRQLSSSVRFTDGHRLTWRGRGRGNETGTVAYPNSADHGLGDGDVDIEAAVPASQQRDRSRDKGSGGGAVRRNSVGAGTNGQPRHDIGDGKGVYKAFAQSEISEADRDTGPLSTLRLSNTGEEDRVQGKLRIVVTDSGAGISQEDQQLLFKRIVQFHPELLQAGGGSGLGLWITSSIVQMHSGSIKVQSGGAGKGSTFTVEIGMQRSLSAQAAYVSAMAAAAEAEIEAEIDLFGPVGSEGDREGEWDGEVEGDGPALSLPRMGGRAKMIHGRSSSSETKNYSDSRGTVDIGQGEGDDSPLTADKRLLSNGKYTSSSSSSSMIPSPQCVVNVFPSPIITQPMDSPWTESCTHWDNGDVNTHSGEQGHSAPDSVEFLNRSMSGCTVGTATANPLHKTPPLPPLSRSPGPGSRSSSSLSPQYPVKTALEILRSTSCSSPTPNPNPNPNPSSGPSPSSGSRGTSFRIDLDRDCAYDVLVVDDSSLNRKVLCKLLRSAGCTCQEANDGQQAVDRVKERLNRTGTGTGTGTTEEKKEYDAILMDFVMPVMDGPTATRMIRGLGYRGRIFGVTGNTLESDIIHFTAHGANAVLPKPFDFSRFKSLMAGGGGGGGGNSS